MPEATEKRKGFSRAYLGSLGVKLCRKTKRARCARAAAACKAFQKAQDEKRSERMRAKRVADKIRRLKIRNRRIVPVKPVFYIGGNPVAATPTTS